MTRFMESYKAHTGSCSKPTIAVISEMMEKKVASIGISGIVIGVI